LNQILPILQTEKHDYTDMLSISCSYAGLLVSKNQHSTTYDMLCEGI